VTGEGWVDQDMCHPCALDECSGLGCGTTGCPCWCNDEPDDDMEWGMPPCDRCDGTKTVETDQDGNPLPAPEACPTCYPILSIEPAGGVL
jgi:hypothetical protein